MLDHRSSQIGDAMLVATSLPAGSHLVRLHPEIGADYDRLIVVTEQDDGYALFLSGWIGPPLTVQQWREAAAALFPAARLVRFARRTGQGMKACEIRL